MDDMTQTAPYSNCPYVPEITPRSSFMDGTEHTGFTITQPGAMVPGTLTRPMMRTPEGINVNPASPLSPVVPGYTGGVALPQVRQGPPTLTEQYYIPGFLKSIMGRLVRAEFIIGTAGLIDRTGIVRQVGVNYFVLEDTTTRTYVMCDLYSVKFVTVF